MRVATLIAPGAFHPPNDAYTRPHGEGFVIRLAGLSMSLLMSSELNIGDFDRSVGEQLACFVEICGIRVGTANMQQQACRRLDSG